MKMRTLFALALLLATPALPSFAEDATPPKTADRLELAPVSKLQLAIDLINQQLANARAYNEDVRKAVVVTNDLQQRQQRMLVAYRVNSAKCLLELREARSPFGGPSVFGVRQEGTCGLTSSEQQLYQTLGERMVEYASVLTTAADLTLKLVFKSQVGARKA